MIEEAIKELEDNLIAILELYNEIIDYDNGQIELLKNDNTDMDQLDHYLERKDSLTEYVDQLGDKCGTLQQRIVDLNVNMADHPVHNGHINELLENIDIKTKMVLLCEQEAKKALDEYILRQKIIIKSNRQNATKTQRYMQNMANASFAVDSVIDTSKKI